jgi:hypothetical protein
MRTDGGRSRYRARRPARQRRAFLRRRITAVLALIAVAAGLPLLLGVDAPSSHPRPVTRTPTAGADRGGAAAVLVMTQAQQSPPSPGTLPQTNTYPSGTSPEFKALMARLWAGVVHDSTRLALPAFFPEAAYAQLKAIGDPQADWSGRLVHDYTLDIAAAHALLGGHATTARLLAVDVVRSYGHWITPGVCSNRIGYYEMPNARVVYRVDGEVRSFGIASMISWRGIWYVVHLGAILRSTDTGMVDDPAGGPGISAYSGTC